MRHPSVRTSARAAVGVLAAATMLPLVGAPAHAEPNSAPVAGDDAVTLYATGAKFIDLLANDTDPDGDELAVCRVDLSPARQVLLAAMGSVSSITLPDYLGFDEDEDLGPLADPGAPLVLAGPKASGTKRFTYYACDRSALTPATVTVTVLPAPKVVVRKVAGKPGRLRVSNPSPLPMRFSWHPAGRITLPALPAREQSAAKPASWVGQVRVPAGTTTTVRVKGKRIHWYATGRNDAFSLAGTVRGIRTR